MDKLRSFFNGEESTADEQNGIIGQVYFLLGVVLFIQKVSII